MQKVQQNFNLELALIGLSAQAQIEDVLHAFVSN